MEIKQCPRCNKEFECQPMNIVDCQCSKIQLTEGERAFIGVQFEDCLCLNCLKEFKQDYHTHQLHDKLKNTRLA